MTVSPPDIEFLASDPWSYQPKELTVDLLKLTAWLIWPGDKYQAQRHQFLARVAAELFENLERRKDRLRNSKRAGPTFKQQGIAGADASLRELREELLHPAGGTRVSYQWSDRDLIGLLSGRFRHMRTATSIVEFILRYDVHLKDERRGPSVTKAAAFIEEDGFKDRDLLKSRSDIIRAWSDYKPVAHLCFADAYLGGPFKCFDVQSFEPLKEIEEFWWDADQHDGFFGVALYAERRLTAIMPSGAQGPLLKREEMMSVEGSPDVPLICPALEPFNEEEASIINNVKTREQWVEKRR